jgi:predicted RNase H-like HicB family nuclease
MRYAIVIEKGPTSYGAYVPDLPGCVAVGKTAAEVKMLIAEAVPLHLAGLREDGLPISDAETECEYVDV